MKDERRFTRLSPRALAVLVIAGLIVGSGLAGVAIDRTVLRPTQAPSILSDNGFHPLSTALRAPTPEDRRRLRRELTRELQLTPHQDSALDAIMAQRARQFSALREEIRPRVERLVSEVRSDVEQILTPAQRDRFRRLQQRDTGELARRMSSAP
jgi:hypothetical protein